MKKISILLSLTLLMQSLGGLCLNTVGAKDISFPVSYNFESGADGWTVRNSDNSSVSVETEGENKYLRLKALKDKTYQKSATLTQIPSAYVVFPNEFVLPKSSTVTVSADIRTNNYADFEKLLMINRSKLQTEDVQYHPATLWGWTAENSVNIYNKDGGRKLSDNENYKRSTAETALDDTTKLANNKWYKFAVELTTDDKSKPSALKLSIMDGTTAVYQGASIDVTNKTLTDFSSIAGLDIAMAVKDITLTADSTLDIDNIMIVASGIGNYWDFGSSLVLKKEIQVRFSGVVDSTKLKDSIKVYNSGNTEVAYTGSYDASKLVYTMALTGNVASGDYTVKIDKTALGLADDADAQKTVTVFLSTLPEVGDCVASGRMEAGKVLTASAQYVQADNVAGACTIQWQSADSADGEFSDITGETGNTFAMTSAYESKHIRFAATPVTNSGIKGAVKYSNVLHPLQAPTAENVKIQGLATEGMEVAITYTFKDANGDAEDKSKSEYFWYISVDGSSNWQPLSCKSKYLTLDSSMVGKYLRAGVIPASVDSPQTTTEYKSIAAFGPVAAAGSDNLITNPGFELGTTSGWGVRNASGDSATLTATQETSYTGSWCGKLEGQTNNSTFPRYSGVTLQANTLYILRAAMKLTDDSGLETVGLSPYDTSEASKTYDERGFFSSATINKDEWKEVYMYVRVPTTTSGTSWFPHCFPGGGKYSVYLDDFYLAPLLVKDIDLKAPTSLKIPQNGEVSADLEAYGAKNQFGNSYGVEDETVYWTIEDAVKGVSVRDSKLYVSDEATAGTVTIKAVCEPSFEGATQERFSKAVEIELIANEDKTPKIKNISLVGDTEAGSVLNLSYDFYQVDGLSDASTVEWYVSDTENGTFTKITGASGKNFSVTGEYVGKFIQAVVVPADSNGGTGTNTESNICGPARAPEAKNITVTGNTYNGQTLTGSYKFYDFNGDSEGATVLKWYRANAQNGTYNEIPGAVGNTYTIGNDDIDSWICFGVTPVSSKAPNDATIYYSNPIQGPVAPTAKNVSISKNGMVLTGKYTYASANGAPEGNTKCEWYLNGNLVASGNQYTLSSTTNGSIEFRVTPVAKTAPYSGAVVSATYTVRYNEPSGITGGGATTTMPTLPSENTGKDDTPSTPTPTPETGKFKDIPARMEWAKESIEKLAEMGILNGKEEDIFAPEDNVTRAEFVMMLMSTLKITAEDAVCDLTDVASGAWYYNAVATAYQKQIVTGYTDGSFGVNDPITRQDASVMIVNALKAANIEIGENKEFGDFSDWGDVSDYATASAEALVKAGILSGSNGMFLPKDYCTRAQAAVMMHQLIVICGIN